MGHPENAVPLGGGRTLWDRAALGVAFAWGVAEAMVFFIVPDVWLTGLALQKLRRALQAVLWAIAGALLGGAVMYVVGRDAPERARAALTAVPGIGSGLLTAVRQQLDAHGLRALLLGPLRGIPYKIYAVEWGARGGSLPAFLVWSVPARGVRFLLGVLATNGLARVIAPWSRRRAAIEYGLLAAFWVGLYAFWFGL